MSVYFYDLNNVSFDERKDIENILKGEEIKYSIAGMTNKEIDPGNPAIWLHDENDLAKVKKLITCYSLGFRRGARQSIPDIKKGNDNKDKKPASVIFNVALGLFAIIGFLGSMIIGISAISNLLSKLSS